MSLGVLSWMHSYILYEISFAYLVLWTWRVLKFIVIWCMNPLFALCNLLELSLEFCTLLSVKVCRRCRELVFDFDCMTLWYHLCVVLSLIFSNTPYESVMCQFCEPMCKTRFYHHLISLFSIILCFVFNALKYAMYALDNTSYVLKWSFDVLICHVMSILSVMTNNVTFLDFRLVPKAFAFFLSS